MHAEVITSSAPLMVLLHNYYYIFVGFLKKIKPQEMVNKFFCYFAFWILNLSKGNLGKMTDFWDMLLERSLNHVLLSLSF